jgi:2-polyprenyl-3-methyl-5-hydroxy-6-metoxy-1,4-benzoquinol methylase
MFFQSRSAQAEYFDRPDRPEPETAAAFRDLDRLNRVFLFGRPFEEVLPGWLGPERCRQLELLDLGAGTGLLGQRLSAWAAGRGWRWRFTNLDLNRWALQLDGAPRAVAGSALALPFADANFDVVVASQMTHHLTNPEIVLHWREAWRVTRDALLICDLHRNAGLYAMLWLAAPMLGIGRQVREDALTSVQRGFRLREWRELAKQAGLPGATVWLYYGTRIVMQARKGG